MDPRQEPGHTPEVEPSSALSDKSLGELLTRFAQDTSLLVRKEIELGKEEIVGRAKTASKDAGLVAGGGVLAHIGLLALVTGIILVIGLAIPYWGSALLVGALLVAAGAAMAVMGRKRLQRVDLAPNRTIESVKKSALAIKDHEPWHRAKH